MQYKGKSTRKYELQYEHDSTTSGIAILNLLLTPGVETWRVSWRVLSSWLLESSNYGNTLAGFILILFYYFPAKFALPSL